MNRLIKAFKQKNMICGYLYFYIHLITEIASFYFLTKITNNSSFIWLVPLIYDGMAFVPQSLIGNLNDKYIKLNSSLIGLVLMIFAYLGYFLGGLNLIYFWLVVLCLGNAFIHIGGAEATLRVSQGKLSHSAIFVSSGSFGVILGRLLATAPFERWWGVVLLMLTIIPYSLLAKLYENEEKENYIKFDYVKNSINPRTVIVIAVFIIIIRGYMGYGIPTFWNKTTIQNIIFYFIMGIGKALGGILSDSFGIKKVAVLSTILAIPFLCFGSNFMIISLIGVMFFSMTMSITLAMISSVLPEKPGLSFGITTISLFLGTVPIFFIKLTNIVNIFFIIVMSLICMILLMCTLKEPEKEENKNEMDL